MNTNNNELSNSSSINKTFKKELYFGRTAKYFMEYILAQDTTCEQILSQNKHRFLEILKLIKKIPENFNLDEEIEKGNYYFCITQSKNDLNADKNKKLFCAMDIKLDLEDKIYDLFFIQENLILCFLEKNNSKVNLRKKARSLFVLDKDIYEDSDSTKLTDNNLKENNPNEKLYNKNIFYLGTKNFVKKDITIDYNKIYFIKDKTEINIKDIKSIQLFLHNSEEYKNSGIKGDKMHGYIIIKTYGNDNYIFGHKKPDLYAKLAYTLKACLNNIEISLTELDIDNNIYSYKSGLFATFHLIVENCFSLKEILSNKEKRKIFLSIFPQRKIGEIMDKIIEYKSLNKKEKYLESWTLLKQILVYLKPYMEMKKEKSTDIKKENEKNNINKDKIDELLKVLDKVDMEKYEKISNEANDSLTKLYDTMKNKKNEQNNFQNILNDTLKKLLEDNLFDELFESMCKFYIIPFFNDVIIKSLQKGDSDNNRLEIKKKFQLLLPFYYFKFTQMKFNFIGKQD